MRKTYSLVSKVFYQYLSTEFLATVKMKLFKIRNT